MKALLGIARIFGTPLQRVDSLFVESFLGCQSPERRSLFPLIRSSEALSVSLTEFEEGEFSLDTFSSSVTIALPRLWWKEY